MLRLIAFLWAFCQISALRGQEIYHRIFDAQHYLSTDVVYDLEEDKRGFLYVATNRGVFRYNGREFKRLVVVGGREQAFTDLVIDGYGDLWVRNFSNEVFKMTGRDTLFDITERLGIFTEDAPILRLIGGGEYVYMAGGLDVVQVHCRTYASERRLSIASEDMLEGLRFEDFLVDFWGGIYAKTAVGLVYQHPKTNMAQWVLEGRNLILGQGLDGMGDDALYCVQRVGGGELRLHLLRRGVHQQVANLGQSLAADARLGGTDMGEMWLSSSAGLHRWRINEKRWEEVLPSHFHAQKVLLDHEGGYWVATLGNGLVHIPNMSTRSVRLPQTQFSVFDYLPNGDIVAGTHGGDMVQIDSVGNFKFKYKLPAYQSLRFVDYDEGSGRLYHSWGYHRLGEESAAAYASLGRGILPLDSSNILVMGKEALYVAHRDVVKPSTYEIAGNERWAVEVRDTILEDYALLVQRGEARAVAIARGAGRVFAAFPDNLMSFDISKRWRSLTVLSAAQRAIHCSSLAMQGDTIWVATWQDGIMGINGKDLQIVAQYKTAQGLASDECSYLYRYEDELWVVTSAGINKVSTQTGVIEHIGHQYAMGAIAAKGLLVDERFVWLNLGSELVRIDRSSAVRAVPRAAVLQYFVHDGKVIAADGTPSFEPIKQQLELHFELPTTRYAASTFSEYRILPVDSLWDTLPVGVNFIKLPLLEQGPYTLQLRTRNHCCAGPIQTIRFDVQPVFWKTTVFAMGALLGLVFVLYALIGFILGRQRFYRTIHKHAINNQLTALRARMNPHFMYNALNTIQALVLTNQKQMAAASIGNFSQLMRSFLHLSEQEFTNLRDELELLANYTKIEKIRIGDELKVHTEIHLPEYLTPEQVMLPSVLLQPIVENSFKHGLMHRKGEKPLYLKFIVPPPIEPEPNKLHYISIHIIDNGIGRKASRRLNARHTLAPSQQSFATVAMYQRLLLINKLRRTPIVYHVRDHYNEHRQAIGTSVRLDIPFVPRTQTS